MHDPADTPVDDLPATREECQWALFAHLGGLLGAVLGVGSGGFVAPLVIWLIKKDESRFIEDQSKEALNFNISILIAAIGLGTVGFIFSVLTLGLGALLFIPVFAALGLYAIAMPIVAAIKVNAGELYRYPLTLRLIK